MPASPETSTRRPPPARDAGERVVQGRGELGALEQGRAGLGALPPIRGDLPHEGHRAPIGKRNQAPRRPRRDGCERGAGRPARSARTQLNAWTSGFMLAYMPAGFGYQIQTCIVTSAGCQKLNAEPDCGLVVGHPSWLASGTNVPSL